MACMKELEKGRLRLRKMHIQKKIQVGLVADVNATQW